MTATSTEPADHAEKDRQDTDVETELTSLMGTIHAARTRVAVLALVRAAAITRAAYPTATTVRFEWSDQGPYLTTYGYPLDASGSKAALADGADQDEWEDEVDPMVSWLDDDNSSVWDKHVTGFGRGGSGIAALDLTTFDEAAVLAAA